MSNPRPSDATSPFSIRLVLQIEGTERTTVPLQITTERTLVGRSDEDSETKPGLDLGSFGGENNGVSRTHAAFTASGKAVFVQDLGSTNGTRLNGLELIPNQPYRVREGDELEFGHVRVTVRSA